MGEGAGSAPLQRPKQPDHSSQETEIIHSLQEHAVVRILFIRDPVLLYWLITKLAIGKSP